MIGKYRYLTGNDYFSRPWVLFENGTCVIPPDEPLVPEAEKLLKSQQLDEMNVIHCRIDMNHDAPGWIVLFKPDPESHGRVFLYVDRMSQDERDPKKRKYQVALFARKMLVRDQANPKVIHVETKESN